MAEEVEIIIASDTRWLRLIRRVVEEFAYQAGLDAQESRSITLAVGEAVGNVMKHSYKGDPRQKLSLACRGLDGGIEIEVRDQGEPFDPNERPTPPPDELRAGGRGVYLMRTIMDEIEYRREGATNCVRMRKYLKTHVQ